MYVIKLIVEEEAGATHDAIEEQIADALERAQTEGELQCVVVSVETEMGE